MLLSVYTSKEMLEFKDLEDVHYVLGLLDESTNTVIVPPKCKVCGSYVYIDFEIGLAQCSHCGDIFKVYTSNNLNLKKEWKQLGGE